MAYVDFSNIPHRTISQHAIVLDLDETLVHTYTDLNKALELNVREDPRIRGRTYFMELTDVSIAKGEGQKIAMWGVVRPHVREFLQFCFSYFKIVGVWSAGKKEYVHAIVELLFRDISKPHFIYTFDDCHSDQGNMVKPLDKLFHETTISHHIDVRNVFCLDDRDDVCAYNPNNAIIIPRYNPSTSIESIMADDLSLRQLMAWFSSPKVRYSLDPRTVERSDIFNQTEENDYF
ncbi:DNA-directed RNA Pol II C-term-like phosphatase [Pithovirus sibericum]|uniref:DNA-directed RNA Pol II C-term-like phosphatase n=1 Tax=Pithovirus sibericum TaxID=1450746 RepID=W5S6P3_9VIRU|nr:DNA-directed RNA Pol II C-term-like phosphatase [Pithovirus sibericum]AHH02002.1 DNA-directed RNA Pol II C-term-like phosphatase [Pithovirus sibericum]